MKRWILALGGSLALHALVVQVASRGESPPPGPATEELPVEVVLSRALGGGGAPGLAREARRRAGRPRIAGERAQGAMRARPPSVGSASTAAPASPAPQAPPVLPVPAALPPPSAAREAGLAGGAVAGRGGTGGGLGRGGEGGLGGGRGGLGSSGSGPGRGLDVGSILERLRAAAERCAPRARLRGETRTAQIRFCVGAAGQATSIELTRSSGSALLDEAALGCVVPGAQPYPAGAGCLTVPLRFRSAP